MIESVDQQDQRHEDEIGQLSHVKKNWEGKIGLSPFSKDC